MSDLDIAELRARAEKVHRAPCPAGCIDGVACDQCGSYRGVAARARLRAELFDLAPELLGAAQALMCRVERGECTASEREAWAAFESRLAELAEACDQ